MLENILSLMHQDIQLFFLVLMLTLTTILHAAMQSEKEKKVSVLCMSLWPSDSPWSIIRPIFQAGYQLSFDKLFSIP